MDGPWLTLIISRFPDVQSIAVRWPLAAGSRALQGGLCRFRALVPQLDLVAIILIIIITAVVVVVVAAAKLRLTSLLPCRAWAERLHAQVARARLARRAAQARQDGSRCMCCTTESRRGKDRIG